MYIEKKIVCTSNGERIHCELFFSQNPRGTVLMVNGAFATITSLRHTIKYLVENFNVVAFDLPFAGSSRSLNPDRGTLKKEHEVAILLDLMRIYEPDFAVSMSWGGVALLLALAHRPRCLKRAVLGSFAPEISPQMRDYLQQSLTLLAAGDHDRAANLFNRTLGCCLPRIFQGFNARYLSEFASQAQDQFIFHIHNILSINIQQYESALANVNLPLMFVNGELDVYTPPDSVARLKLPHAQIRSERLHGAGHFLDMESKTLWNQMRTLLTDYLLEGVNATPECA